MNAIVCLDCAGEFAASRTACPQCGRPVVWNEPRPASSEPNLRCPQCGEPLPESSRFCNICGHRVPTAEATPPAQVESEAATDRWSRLGGIVGFAVAFAFFRLTPDGLAIKVLAGTLVGLLLGLIPYKAAESRDHQVLAKWSCGACAGAGAIGGFIFAAPLALGLYVWIRNQN